MKTNLTTIDSNLDLESTATALTRERYQRIAPTYDRLEALMERRFRPWREKIWQFARGLRILEVGVGTGKNMEFWPADCKVTGIDLTPGMLEIARQRAKTLNRADGSLFLVDVKHLDFPSRIFDTVIATFVFCSVPDPVQGLRELGRVVRPDGQILLLEHVRIDRPILGPVMDALAPLIVRLYGASINRRTITNVQLAGLKIDHVTDLDRMGRFKMIFARAAS